MVKLNLLLTLSIPLLVLASNPTSINNNNNLKFKRQSRPRPRRLPYHLVPRQDNGTLPLSLSLTTTSASPLPTTSPSIIVTTTTEPIVTTTTTPPITTTTQATTIVPTTTTTLATTSSSSSISPIQTSSSSSSSVLSTSTTPLSTLSSLTTKTSSTTSSPTGIVTSSSSSSFSEISFVTHTTIITNSDGSITTSAVISLATGGTSNGSSTGKTWAIVGGVAGGVVLIVALVFLVWRLSQRRFSESDETEDEIKWPELQPEGQTIAAGASTLNPLGTRRTGGAGIEMGERDHSEWGGDDEDRSFGSSGGMQQVGGGGMSHTPSSSYDQLGLYDSPDHNNGGYYDPFLGPSSAPFPPPQNVYPPSTTQYASNPTAVYYSSAPQTRSLSPSILQAPLPPIPRVSSDFEEFNLAPPPPPSQSGETGYLSRSTTERTVATSGSVSARGLGSNAPTRSNTRATTASVYSQ